MKPFNLKEAQTGKKIVTRSGEEAFFIAYDEALDPSGQVLFRHSTSARSCSIKGNYWGDEEDNPSDLDLFMAEEEIEIWLNIYPDDITLAYGYHTESAANAAVGMIYRAGNKAHRITVKI